MAFSRKELELLVFRSIRGMDDEDLTICAESILNRKITRRGMKFTVGKSAPDGAQMPSAQRQNQEGMPS